MGNDQSKKRASKKQTKSRNQSKGKQNKKGCKKETKRSKTPTTKKGNSKHAVPKVISDHGKVWTAKDIKKVDKEITDHLNERLKRTKYSHELQVLLLGAGGSGKSTIFKQMEKCYKSDKVMNEMQEFVPDLCINIIQDIFDLCKYRILLAEDPSLVAMPVKTRTKYVSAVFSDDEKKEGESSSAFDKLKLNLASTTTKLSLESEKYLETGQKNPFILSSKELQMAAQKISEWNQNIWLLGDNPLTPGIAQIIKRLWADPAMKNTWRNRRRSNIIDNTPYLFDKVIEIADENYVMPFDDFVLIRDQTTGVTQCDLNADTIFGNYRFNITDVGGQRAERSKWLRVFNNIDVVLYIIGFSAYDQVLFEDPSSNCLTETLKLFYETCHHSLFLEIDWIVFFNKSDIFEDKISVVPFTVYRPEFNDEQKHNSVYVREFIQREIEDLFYDELNEEERESRGRLYFHYTCATHEAKVGSIIVSVQCDIIKSQLIKCGYLL